MEPTEYIAVGRLGRARALDGGIFVIPLTDFPDRFRQLKTIHVSVKGQWSEFEVEAVDMVGGRPVMKLKTIDTPEQASALADCELAVTRAQLMPLSPNQYYVFDLIDCSVVDAATDEIIGTITDVQRYPANDVYQIRAMDGRELFCPAVASFVRSVDIAARRVVIERSGLLTNEAH